MLWLAVFSAEEEGLWKTTESLLTSEGKGRRGGGQDPARLS